MIKKKRLETSVDRRKFLGGMAATAATLSIPWIKSAHAASGKFAGKEIRVLTWSDATGRAALENIIKPFAKATGAKVIPDLTGTTSEMIAKIKATASRPQYDVVILSGFGANALVEADLLKKPDLSKIPNLADVEAKYQTGAGEHGIGYFLWSDGLIYNTSAYSAPPKSYSVLWDDINKGKIFLPTPQNIGAMEMVIVASKLAGGDAFTDPEPGFKLLGELKERLLTVSLGADKNADLFRSNSLNAGGPYSPLVLPKFIRDPAYNISGTYDLEEGFFVDLQYMVTPKGHPGDEEVIYALNDFALDPQVQGKMAEAVWYGPINRNAVLSDAAKNDPNVPSPELIENRVVPVDSGFLASVREEWTAKYKTAIGA